MWVGGSPTSPPPSEEISMKLTGFALALCSVALLAGSAAAEVKVIDSGQTLTIDCATDPEISVSGASNTLAVTGACTKISISGASNVVAIASAVKLSISGSMNEVEVVAADKISVSGTSNRVRYERGVSRKSPKVSSTGLKNNVAKKT